MSSEYYYQQQVEEIIEAMEYLEMEYLESLDEVVRYDIKQANNSTDSFSQSAS